MINIERNHAMAASGSSIKRTMPDAATLARFWGAGEWNQRINVSSSPSNPRLLQQALWSESD
jgi:hypothetical protein